MTEFDSLDGFSTTASRGRTRYRTAPHAGLTLFALCLGVLFLACIVGLLVYRAVEDANDRDPAVQREKEELREAWAGYRKDERDRRSAAARQDEEMKILNHGR